MATAAIPRPSFLPADRPWPPQRAVANERHSDGFVQITGQLLHRAELRHSAGSGPSMLTFELDAGAGHPFVVHQLIPAEPNALRAAEIKAAVMDRGALVHVYARGCVPRIDHGIAAIALLDVTDVIPAKQEI